TGRPLAIKTPQPRYAGDPGVLARFERERRAALCMRHPNVVAARGVGRLDDGRPFLAMDLLEGRTLGALLRAGGPLSLPRAVRLADDLLAGLAAVPDAGLVHRDLSPENVFVTCTAGVERAVILDFGFAQAPGTDPGDGVTPDSPGSLVGT